MPAITPQTFEWARLPTDRRAMSQEVALTFVERSGTWYLADDALDGGHSRPWAGPAIAVTRRGGLVTVTDQAHQGIGRTLPGRVERLLGVVCTALEQSCSDRLLVDATTSGSASSINEIDEDATAAAVTFPVSDRRGIVGWRIKINPDEVTALVRDDRLLRHELVHFVMRRNYLVPLWLSEGIAEYVSVYGAPVSAATLPAALHKEVLAHASPTELIPSATFKTFPAASYVAAWATVTTLAERGGLERVVMLYDAYRGQSGIDRGDSYTPRALRKVFGMSEEQLAAETYAALETIRRQ